MNKLIENIWKKYHSKPVTKQIYDDILKKAEASYEKTNGKFKLSTFISWWARQRATKK